MAGRTAAGELTGDRDPRAEGVTPFAPEDDAALRALLRASVVPGAVRVAFTREPRYAAGEGLAYPPLKAFLECQHLQPISSMNRAYLREPTRLCGR